MVRADESGGISCQNMLWALYTGEDLPVFVGLWATHKQVFLFVTDDEFTEPLLDFTRCHYKWKEWWSLQWASRQEQASNTRTPPSAGECSYTRVQSNYSFVPWKLDKAIIQVLRGLNVDQWSTFRALTTIIQNSLQMISLIEAIFNTSLLQVTWHNCVEVWNPRNRFFLNVMDTLQSWKK